MLDGILSVVFRVNWSLEGARMKLGSDGRGRKKKGLKACKFGRRKNKLEKLSVHRSSGIKPPLEW